MKGTSTPVTVKPSDHPISRDDGIMLFGSCFSTEVGKRLIDDGYNVCLNPFGILFNPVSIAQSITRLESRQKFTPEEVIPRDGGFVSFSHHGSFKRATAEEFLENANKSLERASDAFNSATVVIITLGTALVWRHIERDFVVSNCHKVPSKEFRREFADVERISSCLSPIIARHPDKRWIFTVSPIRHLSDGAHTNQLSKSTLLLAIDFLEKLYPENVCYFPAYEIMMDELRDYSAYEPANLTHPNQKSVELIYERFKESFLQITLK